MVWKAGNKRREFLKLAAFSLAGFTTTSARGLYQAQREVIQRPDTPEHAMDLLIKGNQRYVAQKLDLVPGRSWTFSKRDGRTPGAIRCRTFLRRLARAGRIGLRPEHWSSLRGSGGGQYCHAGHHRQPGIWRGGAGSKSHSGAGTHQLRRRQGYPGRQGGTGANQHPVSVHPSRDRPGPTAT